MQHPCSTTPQAQKRAAPGRERTPPGARIRKTQASRRRRAKITREQPASPQLTHGLGPITAPATPAQPHDNSEEEELRALWAMTSAQRVTAMWRGQLTRRQLAKWSSRTPHEVPLLGREFAWIVLRTPEWAEPRQPAGQESTP
jgi:hypothetical protein